MGWWNNNFALDDSLRHSGQFRVGGLFLFQRFLQGLARSIEAKQLGQCSRAFVSGNFEMLDALQRRKERGVLDAGIHIFPNNFPAFIEPFLHHPACFSMRIDLDLSEKALQSVKLALRLASVMENRLGQQRAGRRPCEPGQNANELVLGAV